MYSWYDVIPISEITSRIFISGYAEAAKLATSNPYQISAVLNVHQEPDIQQDPSIVYIHIPFNDGEEIPQQQFVHCLVWLKFMYENGHTLAIHCAAGISRSVIITASFMHYMELLDFNIALEHIKKTRPIANPAPATLISAKRMLRVWPYNGALENAEHDSFEWMDAARVAMSHSDLKCPMRLFLLAKPLSNVPRHLIQCTCKGPLLF